MFNKCNDDGSESVEDVFASECCSFVNKEESNEKNRPEDVSSLPFFTFDNNSDKLLNTDSLLESHACGNDEDVEEDCKV